MSEANGSPSSQRKLPLGAIVAVFLLTLAAWLFFDGMGMPLEGRSTTVVAAIMIAIVVAARWVWTRARFGREKGDKP